MCSNKLVEARRTQALVLPPRGELRRQHIVDVRDNHVRGASRRHQLLDERLGLDLVLIELAREEGTEVGADAVFPVCTLR